MTDYSALRRTMVDRQVRTSDVTDIRLLTAMLALPRERFVPREKIDLAYLDMEIPVSGSGHAERRLMRPMVLAKLIQAAEIAENDHVLDVGCVTGYSPALLGRLAREVQALEEDTTIAQMAVTAVSNLDIQNVSIATGPLVDGWLKAGPYDAVIVEGACEVEPHGLLRQLKDGGRLVCIMRSGPAGKLMLFRAFAGEFSSRPICDVNATVLPGFARHREFVF